MKIFHRFLSWYDAYWRRKHGVERFDELLSFSFDTYNGSPRKMSDGSQINPGDKLAIIHFNRECFTNPTNDKKQNARNALRFRRLIFSSFQRLAIAVNRDEKFADIKAFHGISWLPAHGEKVGFEIEKVPNSITNSIRKFYFKILLNTFFPHLAQQTHRIEPNAYWLTRASLLRNFSHQTPVTSLEQPETDETNLLVAC
jgi:hypothetical protein